MRLYHPGLRISLVWLTAALLLVSCSPPQVTEGRITVQVAADGESISVEVPAGSNVEQVLKAAGINLESLDRTDPPLYTVLGDGSSVRLIRVTEEYVVEQEVIPFEQQVVRNESLPEGEEYWLQMGQNGLQEITIREVFEDGAKISSNPVKSVSLKDAVPQIKMIGVQKPFAPLNIPGRLAYLIDGDAWVMQGTTGVRRQIVGTGDLDGRIFNLSPDGEWLLFTRDSEQEGTINTLWAAAVDEGVENLIDLKVANVVHFADWKPGSPFTVAYSTVEPRPGAPGWQANNDLVLLTFSQSGYLRPLPPVIDTNSGGVYGWWGTDFSWAPDGTSLAYARADSYGVVDLESGEQKPLVEITPLQTFGDWAWVPGLAWSPDGDFLFSVNHPPPAESQRFDLQVTQQAGEYSVLVAPDVGMFAYPVPSPLQELPNGDKSYQVAYLEALQPDQSESSRYQLVVRDRDGSNRRALFPGEGEGGLDPQQVAWSPQVLGGRQSHALAFLYQGNLWLVDSLSGEAWQITGDGLTKRVDWQ
jgi:hypothetical protein